MGPFDPCAVHVRQRKWLAPLDIEIRIAVWERYWAEHAAIEWTLPQDLAAVVAYADTADLIVFLPAIEQPWAPRRDLPKFEDLGLETRTPKLFLFHGSHNAWMNAEVYGEYYSRFGTVAATTLDYVARMNCDYIPSLVDTDLRAELRQEGDPLRIVHAPSDPGVCSTSEFRSVAENMGPLNYINGVPHRDCLRMKARAHCGFDHLRGAFSINSLENATIGLVNLVGTSDAVAAEIERQKLDPPLWPHIKSMGDVKEWLMRLQDCRETRKWQSAGAVWAAHWWRPEQIAKRIAAVYRKAARA